MLKRSLRFHGHGSLQGAYARGASVRGQAFSFKVLQRRHGELRAAVVVSTKVSKKAPVRNRIRRRLFELVRLHVDPSAPTDLVITVYADTIAAMPAAELKSQFLAMIKEARLHQQDESAGQPADESFGPAAG